MMDNPNSRGGRGGNGGGGRRFNRRPWGYIYGRKKNSKQSEEGDNDDQHPRGQGRGRTKNNSRGYYGRKRTHGETEMSPNPNQVGRNVTGIEERDKNLPNPNKRPRNTISNIRSQIISQWEKRMSGYLLYYSKSPPQVPRFEDKFNAAVEFLLSNGYSSKKKVLETEENEYFDLRYECIVKNQSFNEKWPDFPDELIEQPQEVLNVWGLAMHNIVKDCMLEDDAVLGNGNDPTESSNDHVKKKVDVHVPRIQCGIMKLEPVTPLMRIKSSLLGKFITIRGAVVRTGNIRPFCMTMSFLCKICERVFSIDQQDGKYSMPLRCGGSDDCDNTSFFEPVEDAPTTKLVESRRIRIQDMQCSDIATGSMPRTIDCELFNSFVNLCTAGNAVTVTGIVKMNKDVNHGGEQSLHSLYLEVVAVRNHKDAERTMGGHWFSFSNTDYYAIKEIHDTQNLFRLLIASLCPSIYGHELVKAGLLLCLFGGTPQDDLVISRRSDINMLMVGDPGIGKSQMLKMTTELSPKGVYVCGTGSTIAGLTVTLVKDGDDYSLEAGALVMADKGVCCIDEFDKMQSQHNALLESMEQQSISIAKSGVFRTLPARATVIAAANPVGGHYDKTKTVNENIKINSALMSRFDLVFILLDTPDGDFDRKVVEHIMGHNKSRNISFHSKSNASYSDDGNEQCYIPLMERIKMDEHDHVDLIPHPLIRKYIAYAKQYVKPKISKEAAAVLKEYYLRLRVKHKLIDSTPVTTRQLESLVRLAEARAKIELREVATEDDAKDILEIFEASLCSAFEDEVVAVSALSQSILVSTCGSKKSQANKANAKRLISTLQRYAEQQSKKLFTVDEIKDISSALGLRSVVNSLIEALNNEGFLLNKGSRTYQLQSVDF